MLCRHRQSIINSLQDTDISIRRRSLDLLFAMCSRNNVREIVAELLDYLQARPIAHIIANSGACMASRTAG